VRTDACAGLRGLLACALLGSVMGTSSAAADATRTIVVEARADRLRCLREDVLRARLSGAAVLALQPLAAGDDAISTRLGERERRLPASPHDCGAVTDALTLIARGLLEGAPPVPGEPAPGEDEPVDEPVGQSSTPPRAAPVSHPTREGKPVPASQVPPVRASSFVAPVPRWALSARLGGDGGLLASWSYSLALGALFPRGPWAVGSDLVVMGAPPQDPAGRAQAYAGRLVACAMLRRDSPSYANLCVRVAAGVAHTANQSEPFVSLALVVGMAFRLPRETRLSLDAGISVLGLAPGFDPAVLAPSRVSALLELGLAKFF
jgi:hypothetical protein